VLAAWGALSNSGPLLREMMEEVAHTVTGVEIAQAGHWIPEENPAALTAALLELLKTT
jgi:pimeloyl-ACP methyl ester carboxylesterase